jgi:hypothetical protein
MRFSLMPPYKSNEQQTTAHTIKPTERLSEAIETHGNTQHTPVGA